MFPYKRNIVNPEELFSNLVKRDDGVYVRRIGRGERVNTNGFPPLYDSGRVNPSLVFTKTKTNWSDFAILTDYFSEKQRYQARVKGHPTFLEWYNRNEDELQREFLEEEKESVCDLHRSYDYSEFVWTKARRTGLRSPTNFNTAISKSLYKFFDSKKVLDPSAGWGDRLLGALASVDLYHGVDPNTQMGPVYKEMVDFGFNSGLLSKKTKGNFRVFTEDFLQFKVNKNFYDTVFTSPPYFDYEIYSDEPTQSIKQFPVLEDWINNFLFPYLDKCFDALKFGGILALHLSDTTSGKYTDRMVEYLSEKMYYKGLLFIGGGGLVPVWVFQKVNRKNNPVLFKKESRTSDKRKLVKRITQDPSFLRDQLDLEPPILQRLFRRTRQSPSFVVLDDSVLLGGTKQRLFNRLVRNIQEPNVIYVGPETGYAQIALALTAKKYSKTAHVFISNYSGRRTKLTELAETLGAKVYAYKLPLRDIRKHTSIVRGPSYEIPFGGESNQTEEMYISALKYAIRDVRQPRRLWLAAGSAFTLKCLQKIWPETQFMVVQVGKKVDWFVRKEDRLFVSKYKFYQNTRNPPPYDSLMSYDAKIWDFFVKYGREGDYIWNVAGNL